MVQPQVVNLRVPNEESGQNMDTMHDRQMARREQDFSQYDAGSLGDPLG